MNKIVIITANLGFLETRPLQIVPQTMKYDLFNFDDSNFLLRTCSMTARLQARIVKMFGWQMVPGYDFYIWVDSSSAFFHQDCVQWYVDHCINSDIAVFEHPRRSTIREEADYIDYRINQRKCEYLTPRYKNELIKEQMEVIENDNEYIDDKLYCSTAFIYRNNKVIQDMMIQWWYHTSRFHSVDQLSFPYVLKKSGCQVATLPYEKGHHSRIYSPYLTFVRNNNKYE